jgi:hypothetical protein
MERMFLVWQVDRRAARPATKETKFEHWQGKKKKVAK